jgi:hypothetical protein
MTYILTGADTRAPSGDDDPASLRTTGQERGLHPYSCAVQPAPAAAQGARQYLLGISRQPAREALPVSRVSLLPCVRPKPVLANDRFHARGRKVEQNDHRVVRSTSLLFVRFESFVPPLSEPTAEMSSLAVTASTRW